MIQHSADVIPYAEHQCGNIEIEQISTNANGKKSDDSHFNVLKKYNPGNRDEEKLCSEIVGVFPFGFDCYPDILLASLVTRVVNIEIGQFTFSTLYYTFAMNKQEKSFQKHIEPEVFSFTLCVHFIIKFKMLFATFDKTLWSCD